jgi:hypothetical protein
MFFISMPKTFGIGDTADCRINKEPARLTWRDSKTLVIEPNDARVIITTSYEDDLIHFTCGDAGDAGGKATAMDDGSYLVTAGERGSSSATLPGLPGGPPLKH